MKPFDLEAAKAGAPLITRDGETVKFVAHIPEAADGQKIVIFSPRGGVRMHFEDGTYYSEGEIDEWDLFMAPIKKTVWVNFQPGTSGIAYFYDDEETANKVGHDERLGGKAYCVEIDV